MIIVACFDNYTIHYDNSPYSYNHYKCRFGNTFRTFYSLVNGEWLSIRGGAIIRKQFLDNREVWKLEEVKSNNWNRKNCNNIPFVNWNESVEGSYYDNDDNIQQYQVISIDKLCIIRPVSHQPPSVPGLDGYYFLSSSLYNGQVLFELKSNQVMKFIKYRSYNLFRSKLDGNWTISDVMDYSLYTPRYIRKFEDGMYGKYSGISGYTGRLIVSNILV